MYYNIVRHLKSNMDIDMIESFFTSVSRGIGGFITTNGKFNGAPHSKLYLYDLEEDDDDDDGIDSDEE